MSARNATTSGTTPSLNAFSAGLSSSPIRAVIRLRDQQQTTTVQYNPRPKYAIVLESMTDPTAREAHIFGAIDKALLFQCKGRNKRIVRLPSDLVYNERALWETIDRADAEKRSIPLER